MKVLLDGIQVEPGEATISVFDWGVLRGFGVFEVVRTYDSVPFRLDAHLARLERSAAALAIPIPAVSSLREWVMRCAEHAGECQVRIVVTGGGRDTGLAPSRTIVKAEPLPVIPDRLAVLPMRAPWHPATNEGGFSGIKWISYAPNMTAIDRARGAGFDDALLLGPDDVVLEGPTHTLAWLRDGHFETPSFELGILPSITRDVFVEAAGRLGVPIIEGIFALDRLLGADEVFGMSTLKQLVPIERVGDRAVPVGPMSVALAEGFAAIVRAEIAAARPS